ncbi:MAG: hypothetical protein MUC65_10260, partial [Pontiellaceae bacterium]|nr:hypothetical protein [Pontiellaceae bacterium]
HNQIEVLLSTSVCVVFAVILMALISAIVGKWPSIHNSAIFQVIIIFADICILTSLGVMVSLGLMWR